MNSKGIIAGLCIGKPFGIFLCTFLAAKVGWSTLPGDVSWKQILGAGMLAGIGFTMSIFIALLAFNDPLIIDTAKVAILCGSVLSCLTGVTMLFIAGTEARKTLPDRDAACGALTAAGGRHSADVETPETTTAASQGKPPSPADRWPPADGGSGNDIVDPDLFGVRQPRADHRGLRGDFG